MEAFKRLLLSLPWILAVCAALRPGRATCDDKPAEFKVFAKVASHTDEEHLGPIHFKRTSQQLVIRSPHELALHSLKSKDAKNPAIQKELQAQLCKLLKVETIDWDRQMVIAISGLRFRFKKEVEFLSFEVKQETLRVNWRNKDLGKPGLITTPRGAALVQRFDGKVVFDPAELK